MCRNPLHRTSCRLTAWRAACAARSAGQPQPTCRGLLSAWPDGGLGRLGTVCIQCASRWGSRQAGASSARTAFARLALVSSDSRFREARASNRRSRVRLVRIPPTEQPGSAYFSSRWRQRFSGPFAVSNQVRRIRARIRVPKTGTGCPKSRSRCLGACSRSIAVSAKNMG